MKQTICCPGIITAFFLVYMLFICSLGMWIVISWGNCFVHWQSDTITSCLFLSNHEFTSVSHSWLSFAWKIDSLEEKSMLLFHVWWCYDTVIVGGHYSGLDIWFSLRLKGSVQRDKVILRCLSCQSHKTCQISISRQHNSDWTMMIEAVKKQSVCSHKHLAWITNPF